MDKRALAQKIQTLEGLSNEEKSAMLALLHEQKKYGLIWEDKPEDVEIQLNSELPVLTEVKERAIVSENKNAPNHILIEGDNLHAITVLTYTHAGKIDVIYIDPPYNTGNKDFIFNDSYVDKEDSYRHSKWLSFMSKRLEIAKILLSEKGVIFISVDDNEQAQLKLICDEIFGENNFVAEFTIASNSSKNNSKFVSVFHEYLMCYALNISKTLENWAVDKSNLKEFLAIISQMKKKKLSNTEISDELKALVKYPKFYEFDHYTYVDDRGPFRASDLTAPGSTAWYDIPHPVTGFPCKTGTRGWGFSKNVMDQLIEDDKILFGKDENNIPQLKNYLSENERSLPKSVLFFDSQASTKWMKAQRLDFSFPKALEYIEYIISMFPMKEFTILDFFAGSGTTLHATMQLNADDGGHRQCILVTNNENNICEEITYERNRRVIQGYTNTKGDAVEGLNSNNLRYYKIDFVPRKPSLKNRRMLMAVSTDLLCIKNNVYQEQSQFCGKKWKPDCLRFFANEWTQMLVIYNEKTIPFVVQVLKNETLTSKIRIYVFSNSQYAFEDDFAEILDKVELCALPDAIYNAYKNVLPPLPPELLDEEVEKHD